MLARQARVLPGAKAIRCEADTDDTGPAAASRTLTRAQAQAACRHLRHRESRPAHPAA